MIVLLLSPMLANIADLIARRLLSFQLLHSPCISQVSYKEDMFTVVLSVSTRFNLSAKRL